MEPYKLIIFVAFFIGVVSGKCNISQELVRMNEEIEACESGSSPVYVRQLFTQLGMYLNLTQFAIEVRQFCNNIPTNMLTCLTQNVAVGRDCQEKDEIQSLLNYKVAAWYETYYYCKNNALLYLHMAADDGSTCYGNSDLFQRCIMQKKYEHVVFKLAPNSNSHICKVFEVLIECSSVYGLCGNRNIRRHFVNAQQELQQRFGCVVAV